MSPILGVIDSSKAKFVANPSFESIATISGNGSSNTITFSSIPQTYQYLQIRAVARDGLASTGGTNIYVRFNGTSSASYNYSYSYGDQSTGHSAVGSTSTTFMVGLFNTNNLAANDAYGVGIMDIHDYASTTRLKTIRSFHGFNSNTLGFTIYAAGNWNGATDAITSISLVSANTQGFTTQSLFALYGIKG